jgi:hypothetical protein
VSVCACVCACVCVCMYVCLFDCLFDFLCVYVCMRAGVYVCHLQFVSTYEYVPSAKYKGGG